MRAGTRTFAEAAGRRIKPVRARVDGPRVDLRSHPALRPLRSESGQSLIELLVVITMLIAVLGAAMTLLIGSIHSENAGRQYAGEIQDSQAGMSRMMQDVRQASRILLASANTVRFVLPGSITDSVVQYECDVTMPGATSYRECTRVSATLAPNADPNSVSLPAASTGIPLVLRLTNGAITDGTSANAVFHYSSPDATGVDATGQPVDASGAPVPPTYVEGKAIVPAAGETAGTHLAQLGHNTILWGGAYLRNADVGA
jgi:type II secretory pathway pseudopilin PulG